MSRRPLTFKQRDLTRALRATVAAGVSVAKVEIDKDGRIVIVTAENTSEAAAFNEWDDDPNTAASRPSVH